MPSTNMDKKEPAPYVVGTAKMPKWLFDELESFRQVNHIPTRSAAINALVAIGLREEGIIDKTQCQRILLSEDLGCSDTGRSEE